MRTPVLIILLICFAGCSTTPRRATESLVTASIAVYLGSEAADFVASRMPPASTKVSITTPSDSMTPDPLLEAFERALRDRGFGVGVNLAGVPKLTANAVPSDHGVVLFVDVNGEIATRFYTSGADGFAAASPFTVREVVNHE